MAQEVKSIRFKDGSYINIPHLTVNTEYDVIVTPYSTVFMYGNGSFYYKEGEDLEGNKWYYDDVSKKYYAGPFGAIHTMPTDIGQNYIAYCFLVYQEDRDAYLVSVGSWQHNASSSSKDICFNGYGYGTITVNEVISDKRDLWAWWSTGNLQTWFGYIGNPTMTSADISNSSMKSKLGAAANGEWEDDPFGPGGGSGEGGGGGDFDNTSTPIEIPNLPSISAANTGFISLFNPSLAQLIDLSSYLWSDLFEIDGWKKLFADPMDAILGLSILPVAVPSGGTREVKVGNIGTGISLTVAASQFVEVDCGSIDVNEYWGAYLDYEPYTQAQIFLPYIGTRPISVDDIMGKTVRVVYHVDILTGACCCFVKCGDSVLYTYNGQCSIPIPITGANYTSVVNGVISIAASVGSLVATGGASAPIALPSIANSAVNQMKPQVEKSGSISGSAGILNMQTPYLILIRPRQALPSKQNEFIGYPSLITVQLTELTGYTEVQSIHLENIPATQEELAEIQSLLEGGVIF